MVTVVEPTGLEAAAVRRTVSSISAAGARLTATQRRNAALRSRQLASTQATEPVDASALDDLVRQFTTAPQGVRPTWIAALAARGVDAVTYLEVLAVVARLRAIDTFCFALGVAPAELPPTGPGRPTGAIARDAAIDGGWAPTVGRASPPNALSAIPAEHQAMHDLHGAFYLSIADMVDLDADRGLHRTQMEFVAARTSLLNECFY